jgi:hypothetical protein
VALIGLVELSARLVIFVLRGTATAGLPERTLNLQYEPFVMFGPGWDRRFAALPVHGNVPIAMLVGGSTANGFAPEILERAMERRFNRRVAVVNAAFGAYVARQEVVVASIWAPRLAPALLITLDGHNDLDHRLRVSAPGRFFLDQAYRTYLTQPTLAPLVWLVARSQAYNGLVRWLARRQLADWTAYADAIPVYIDAQHSMNVIARGLRATRLMVLQPFVAFKQPLAREERAFTAYAYREGAMRELYDRTADALAELATRDHVAFLDARRIYNGVPEALFTDDVHFRDSRGYELLARAIVDALPDDALAERAPQP